MKGEGEAGWVGPWAGQKGQAVSSWRGET
jgi:hypothetical protein